MNIRRSLLPAVLLVLGFTLAVPLPVSATLPAIVEGQPCRLWRRCWSGPLRRWQHRHRKPDRAAPQSPAGRSLLPPLFQCPGPAARAQSAERRFRGDRRRRSRLYHHQQSCHRQRRQNYRHPARRPRAQRQGDRFRSAKRRGGDPDSSNNITALPLANSDSCGWVISWSPSATRSGWARPSPRASSARWAAPADQATRISSRPTPRSIPATPAARW